MENIKDLPEPTAELRDLVEMDEEDRNPILVARTTAYLRQHKLDEAVSFLRNYVEMMKQLHGEEDFESCWASRVCGLLLVQDEKYAEAESFLREYFAYTMEYIAESDEFTRSSQIYLGHCLLKTKKFEEASRIFKDLLAEQKEVLGEKDPETLGTVQFYLKSLLESQKTDEILSLLNDCFRLIETISHDDGEEVKTKLLCVGFVLLEHGKCKLGQDIIQNVLVRQLDLFGPEHPETVEMMESTFNTMLHAAQESVTPEYSILVLRSRWNVIKKFLGESHVDTIAALEWFADLAWHLCESESTLRLSQKIFDLRKRTLGDDHQDTISARETLQSRMSKLKHPEPPATRVDKLEAHPVSQQAGEASNEGAPKSRPLDSRNSEGKGNHGNRDPDQLCQFCCGLDTTLYLRGSQVETVRDGSYPSGEQTAWALLSRWNCPLCRLIVTGFSTRLSVKLAQLDPNTKVSYGYVWSDVLDRHCEEGFSSLDDVGLTADILLLEVSVQQQRCLWLYAVDTGGGIVERIEAMADAAMADASLTLHSSSRHKEGLKATEYDIYSAITLLQKDSADELRSKLAYLGEKYGYLKGRLVDELVDARLPKTWLHCCDSHHGKACQPIDMNKDSHWRPSWLIDVYKGMLVPGDEGGAAVRYAALSYVWGDGVKQLKNTVAGDVSESIKKPGGLMEGSENIPPDTIKDAMSFCRKIGITYLWVDAICLDQDNITQDVLDTMGKIYQGAYVTIVAGAGQDSWAGLSGISRRRPCQESCTTGHVGNMSLGLYSGSRQAIIKNTKWSKRGWTFQEMLMSRRLLIFTEKEVLYQCGSGMAWRESVFLEHPHLASAGFSIVSAECKKSQLSSTLDNCSPNSSKVMVRDIYQGLIKGYLLRQLKCASDVLKALQGILTVIAEQTGENFHKGIPTSDVFRSLLFNVTGSPYSLRRPKFPSWSWCGWQKINGIGGSSTACFEFIEPPSQSWFEPNIDLYWSTSTKDSNNSNAGGVYSFTFIDGQNKEADIHEIRINGTDKEEAWRQSVPNMLVFSADILHVAVTGQGEPISRDPEMRRYTILSPDLGLKFLDLNKNWREKQPERLELLGFARAKSFDERDMQVVPVANGPFHGTSFVRDGWEDYLVPLVAVLLVETDTTTSISQRLGLYTIEEEYWDLAAKSRRTVYLC